VKKTKKYDGVYIYEVLNNIRWEIQVLLWFVWEYTHGAFLVLKNVKRDSKKYDLPVSSILYNALIKYPLIGFIPSNFFLYRLYENSYKDYMNFFERTIKVGERNNHMYYLLINKLRFKLHIRGKIKNPKLIAYFDHKSKKITNYAKPSTDKIVIKPTGGSGGMGVKVISSDRFIEELKKCSRDYLAEEFIEQHNLINKIFSGSVNTVRVLTLKKNEDVIVIKAMLRVGGTHTKGVDNISLGGIGIDINMESGKLGKGRPYYQYDDIEYKRHPHTKYRFYGQTLPYFKEAKELAINAHKCFPMFTLIGWDIAITETGPTIIEGNRVPNLSGIQAHGPLKKKLGYLFN